MLMDSSIEEALLVGEFAFDELVERIGVAPVILIDVVERDLATFRDSIDPSTDVLDESIILKLSSPSRHSLWVPINGLRNIRTEVLPTAKLFEDQAIRGQLQEHRFGHCSAHGMLLTVASYLQPSVDDTLHHPICVLLLVTIMWVALMKS